MKKETELNRKSVLRMSNLESKQLTRECIQTSLLHLLKDIPFEKITVTAIIEHSGVSRAGFYRNFSSKEEVLEHLALSMQKELTDFITNEKYKNNEYQWYVDLFQAIKKRPDIYNLLILANVPHSYIFDTASPVYQLFPTQTVKGHYHFIAIGNALKEVIIDWFQNGMKESLEEMASIFMELFYPDSKRKSTIACQSFQ